MPGDDDFVFDEVEVAYLDAVIIAAGRRAKSVVELRRAYALSKAFMVMLRSGRTEDVVRLAGDIEAFLRSGNRSASLSTITKEKSAA